MTDIIARSMAKGLRMTDQRRVIARVLGEAFDHPDVEELYARAARIDARISLATVYRTVKLFEEAGLLERHEFGAGLCALGHRFSGVASHALGRDDGGGVVYGRKGRLAAVGGNCLGLLRRFAGDPPWNGWL